HSASIQTTSRLPQDVIGPDGTVYPKGTAIPQRADFNTLDNPFAFSSQPARDGRRPARRHEARGRGAQPRAGLQLGADDDAPPELPRAAAPAPLFPALRALTRTVARLQIVLLDDNERESG